MLLYRNIICIFEQYMWGFLFICYTYKNEGVFGCMCEWIDGWKNKWMDALMQKTVNLLRKMAFLTHTVADFSSWLVGLIIFDEVAYHSRSKWQTKTSHLEYSKWDSVTMNRVSSSPLMASFLWHKNLRCFSQESYSISVVQP